MALLLMEDDVDQMRDQMHEEQYKLRVERMQYFIQEAFEAYQFIGDIKDDEHRAFQEKLKNFLVVVQEDMQSFAKTLNIKGNKLLSNSYNSSWNGYQEKTKKIAKELQDAVSKLNRPLDVAQKQIFEKILAKIEKKYTQALVELKASDIRRILMHKLLEDELSTLAKTINAHPICFISYSWGPWDRVDSEHTGRVHRLAAHLKASGLKVVLDIWDNQVGDIHVFTQKIFTADKVLVMGSPHLVEKYNNYCSSGESRGMSDSYRGNVVAKEITYVLQRIGRKPPDNHGIVLGLMDGVHDKSFPEALQFLPSSDTDFAGSATISVDYVTKFFNLLERLFSENYHLILKASKSKLEQLFGQLLHESDKQKLWNAYEKTYQRLGLLQWDKILEESTVAPLQSNLNSAIQLFIGNNPKGPSHLDFKTWYYPETCHYLLQLVDNNACCVPVVFLDAGYGNNTRTFKDQLEALILLANKLDSPAVFIAKEPGAEIHFISGLVNANQLILINPLGMSTHQDCYQTLAELQRTKILSTIWLSSTCLQRNDYEEVLVSCGPISIELIIHILEKWTPDNLNVFWTELKNNGSICHEKAGLKYIELSVENILPQSLKNLLEVSAREDYQHQMIKIRQTHYQLLKNKPEQSATKKNVSVEVYLQQIKEEASSQVVFNALVTKAKNILDINILVE